MRSLRIFLVYLALGSGFHLAYSGDAPPKVDGLYSLCAEVAGFSGETLELKDGKFRYWFYTDMHVVGAKEIKFPLTGKFKIEGRRVILSS